MSFVALNKVYTSQVPSSLGHFSFFLSRCSILGLTFFSPGSTLCGTCRWLLSLCLQQASRRRKSQCGRPPGLPHRCVARQAEQHSCSYPSNLSLSRSTPFLPHRAFGWQRHISSNLCRGHCMPQSGCAAYYCSPSTAVSSASWCFQASGGGLGACV